VFRLYDGVTSNNQLAIQLVDDGGGNVNWQYTTSDSSSVVTLVLTGTSQVVAGRWYFIIGLKTSFTQRLFVNGVDENTVVAGIPSTVDASRSVSIGLDGRTNTAQFDGEIHSVALWDVAISEGSVRATYNGGWKDLDLRNSNHPHYSEGDSLQHWFRFGQSATGRNHGDIFVSDWRASNDAAMAPGTEILISNSGVGFFLRSEGSWLEEGFQIGQNIGLSGSAVNDGTYTTLLVLDDSMVVTVAFTPEAVQTDLVIATLGSISITEQVGTIEHKDVLSVKEAGPIGTSSLFDGSSALSTSTAQTVGIGDVWSVSSWIKPSAIESLEQSWLYIGDESGGLERSSIDFRISGTLSGDPLRVNVMDASGALSKLLTFENVLTNDEWFHVMALWDGASLSVYLNGELLVPTSESGAGGSLNDEPRFIDVGGSVSGLVTTSYYLGQVGHVGVWNALLTENEIQQIAFQGHCTDLRYNVGSYVSAENLQRYYKPGEDTIATGRDFIDMNRASVRPLTAVTGTPVVVGEAPAIPITVPPFWSVEVDNSVDEMITVGRNNSIPRPVTWGGANWSFAMWIKPQSITPLKGTTLGLFDDVDVQWSDLLTNKNRKLIDSYQAGGVGIGNWTFDVLLYDTSAYNSGPWIYWVFDGGSSDISSVYSNGLNEWNFICVTYDESKSGVGNIISVYINGSKISPTSTSGTSIVVDLDVNIFRYLNFGATGRSALSSRFVTDNMGAARYHRAGLWNATLVEAEQAVLYNGGAGASIDWLVNRGAYVSQGDLEHYYRFGEDQSNLIPPDTSLAFDTGLTTSSGWHANGSDLAVGFPDAVADAPV